MDILLVVLGICLLVIVLCLAIAYLLTWVMNRVDTFTRQQMALSASTMRQVSELVVQTTTESINKVVGVILGEAYGKPGTPVDQGHVPQAEDMNNPAWFTWDDGPENEHEVGTGDSVYFERVNGDDARTVGIQDGEQIIPGVPLPDMTGENYHA